MKRLQEIPKSKMSEIAQRNQMEMEALGDKINEIIKKIVSTEENEKTIEDFKKVILSKSVVL